MRKMMLIGLALAMVPGMAWAGDASVMAADKAEAQAAIKAFGAKLKGELGAAMKAGGPLNALEVCHQRAPEIAAEISQASGLEIRRTSLKIRNPGDAPDAWERKVLKSFEARKAKGEAVAKLDQTAIVTEGGQKVFRYMKAIPTEKVCTTCHGAKVAPEVAAKIKALYPDDAARGFAVGDIRGAFSVKKKL